MRILLIEDDEVIAERIKVGLERASMAVDVASDGEAGLQMAQDGSYALLILDLMLPKRDGWSVCEALRRQGDLVPILMLTARDGVGDRVRGLEMGADDYLSKPFDFSEFLARVRALLRRDSIQRSRALTDEALLEGAWAEGERSSSLPTGTVTLLFTDIEGSTRLWDEHPESMRTALARHDAILRFAIETNGGHVFKTIGDAFCSAFATAPEAVSAAIQAQRALHHEEWGEVGWLRVRMAAHTSAVERRGSDYWGPGPNRVARLLAAAHGGQVLLTQATADLAQHLLPKGTSLRALGTHHLRDLAQPEAVFQLLHADLPAGFPPLRSLRVSAGSESATTESPGPSSRERGIQALREGNIDEAINLLIYVVAADGQDADATALLGVAYSQKGLHDPAKRALQMAVELQPRNAVYRFNLGIALERAGDAAGAAGEYRTALRIDPEYAQARRRLQALTGRGPAPPS